MLVANQASLRVWMKAHAERISDDGAFFTTIARQLPIDPHGTVKQYPLHPGYPTMMVGANWLLTGKTTGASRVDWERAGVAVSLVASIGVLLGVWLVTAWMFNNGQLGWIAAMLLGFGKKHAVLGAEVLSDTPMLCLQLGSLLAAMAVIRRMDRERSDRVTFLLALVCGLLAGS